jgi:hypothetical protein
MEAERIVAELEYEWGPEDGFFWRIRQGEFAESDYKRALSRLVAIPVFSTETVPRRLVSLLWYIPLFMSWQVERVRENGGDEARFADASRKMSNEVERVLGVP